MKQHLEVINFLKGFSITTIVLMHLMQNFPLPDILLKAISFGGAGIHVFILCSGFGLYYSYLNRPLKFIPFLKKRFLKVYIPYAIVILLSATLPLYYTYADKWLAVCSHLFLFKMFNSQYMNSFGGQMWFVSMIFQCYLIFIILTHLFKKLGGARLLVISLFISILYAVLVGVIGKVGERIWDGFFLQYLWEFVLGMYLAKIYKSTPEKIEVPSWKFLFSGVMIGIPIVAVTGLLGGAFKLYNDIPSFIGYISIALIIYKLGFKAVNRFFIFTNTFSFEWYLTHFLVFFYCFYFFKDTLNPFLLGAISLGASYLLGWLYNKVLHVLKLK